ncbi:MAG: capsular biosynthesis protein [Nitrococcus sp.]|nr:capsular biosynthesis protein [Nitrococcus sp.]
MPGRVLLLQGPVGPFFSLLAEELKSEGHEVFKIHFNGGDEVCYTQTSAYRYRRDLLGWPAFLRAFIARHEIDRIFLFGDCRPYHRRAIKVARELGVAVFVFEEGYVRPDYVTLEPGGVNAHSALSREPGDYVTPGPVKQDVPQPAGGVFWRIVGYAVRYYLAAWWLRGAFPHYEHHRPLNPFSEGLRWVRSGLRKLYYLCADYPLARRLSKQQHSGYYLVPLQVHCDAQVTHHSRYASIEDFIAEVIGSFAAHAPADTELVFRQHPMERAYHDYGRLIARLAARYRVRGRVHYLHEGHLPMLLHGARGTVTINSTVGLSSVYHRTPVKVMGYAVYDIPGLTCEKPLDAFWQAPGEVDHRLYRRFRKHLVANVLGNGSFYRRVRADRGSTGIEWPLGSLSAASDPARAGVLPIAARVGEEVAVGTNAVSPPASAAARLCAGSAKPNVDWSSVREAEEPVSQSFQGAC